MTEVSGGADVKVTVLWWLEDDGLRWRGGF